MVVFQLFCKSVNSFLSNAPTLAGCRKINGDTPVTGSNVDEPCWKKNNWEATSAVLIEGCHQSCMHVSSKSHQLKLVTPTPVFQYLLHIHCIILKSCTSEYCKLDFASC